MESLSLYVCTQVRIKINAATTNVQIYVYFNIVLYVIMHAKRFLANILKLFWSIYVNDLQLKLTWKIKKNGFCRFLAKYSVKGKIPFCVQIRQKAKQNLKQRDGWLAK